MKHKLQKLVWAAACALSIATGRAEGLPAEWPDLPLLSIETVGGEFPTCTPVNHPPGLGGISITDNHYVPGRLVMTLCGDTLLDTGPYVEDDSGMRIRIRGNSSGQNMNQKPYKIKLTRKADLLSRDDAHYAAKDWNLLMISTYNPSMPNAELNLGTALGFIVSRSVGMEWTPGWQYVNLVMNGRYMGMYSLTDAVDRGPMRVNVEKSGYLVENDLYWWNGELYFKTPYQNRIMGWTFKYPDPDDVGEATTGRIRGFIENFEQALFSGGDIERYIDLSSWAKWVLAHDVLCSSDDQGTNFYVYKKDFDEDDPTASPLMMGPLWDFESVFRRLDGTTDFTGWSLMHNTPYFYHYSLFTRTDFRKAYQREWAALRTHLLDDVRRGFAALRDSCGEAYEESRRLHRTVYPYECQNSMDEQIALLTSLVEQRIASLDSLVEADVAVGLPPLSAGPAARPVRVVDLSGRTWPAGAAAGLPPGVYVEVFSDGSTRKLLRR